MVLIITIPKGTDHDIKITVIEEGYPKEITGAEAVCTFVTAHGIAPIITKTTEDDSIEIDGPNGLVTVHIFAGDASVLDVGSYIWECRIFFEDIQEVIDTGTLSITVSDTYGVSP